MQILTGSGLKSEENCSPGAATAWPAKANHQVRINDNLPWAIYLGISFHAELMITFPERSTWKFHYMKHSFSSGLVTVSSKPEVFNHIK